MEYRTLGRTGLKVSVLSYGAWATFSNQIDLKLCKDIMAKAREYGVNFFDNAEVYAEGKAETLMGQAIKELGWKRSDIVVSTKLFWGGKGENDKGLSRKHIIEGTRASLERLGMEYVDLIFCHRPDPVTPIEETVRAMNFVLAQGWAFYWGTSEWSAQQITEAWAVADRLGLVGPAMEQPEYNLLHRDRVEVEYAPLYKLYGLGTTTWSPLSSGMLSGKYSKGSVPEGSRLGMEMYKSLAQKKLMESELEKVDNLKPLAKELGCTTAQLALAWCARNPHVSTVITGATKVEQVEENMKALEVVPKLTPEVLQRIDDIMQSKPAEPTKYR